MYIITTKEEKPAFNAGFVRVIIWSNQKELLITIDIISLYLLFVNSFYYNFNNFIFILFNTQNILTNTKFKGKIITEIINVYNTLKRS